MVGATSRTIKQDPYRHRGPSPRSSATNRTVFEKRTNSGLVEWETPLVLTGSSDEHPGRGAHLLGAATSLHDRGDRPGCRVHRALGGRWAVQGRCDVRLIPNPRPPLTRATRPRSPCRDLQRCLHRQLHRRPGDGARHRRFPRQATLGHLLGGCYQAGHDPPPAHLGTVTDPAHFSGPQLLIGSGPCRAIVGRDPPPHLAPARREPGAAELRRARHPGGRVRRRCAGSSR